MGKVVLLFWAVLAFGIGSCAAPKLVSNPDYPPASVSGGRLAVVFDPPVPQIDIGDYPGEKIEQVYTGFFRLEFPVLAKKLTTLNAVTFPNLVVTLPDNESLKTVSGNTFVRLPESGTRILSDSVDYVLIIQDLRMYRRHPSSGKYSQSTGAGGEPRPALNVVSDNEVLVHELTVAFWDNNRGRLMAHGSLEIKQPVTVSITEESWLDALEEIASIIFDQGPFKRH